MAKKQLAALIAKWRDDAETVDAMGYSQRADRIRDCANELASALSQPNGKKKGGKS